MAKLYCFMLILFHFFNISSQLNDTVVCIRKNDEQDTTTWKLIWESNFETVDELNSWTILNETEKCEGNGVQQESCNTHGNVQVESGFLVMQAMHEHYYGVNYTGARITAKRPFSYGRIEVRATQPEGRQLRTCIFTYNTIDNTGNDIEICSQRSEISRALYYANMNEVGWDTYDVFDEFGDNMNAFHLYGFEWNDKWIRFFIDDNLSQTIPFNETHYLHPSHYLGLYIGVGLGILGQNVGNTDFKNLLWKCPNFLVDYVRYYQKETEVEQSNFTMCDKSGDFKNEKIKIQKICKKSIPPIVVESNLLPIVIIMVTFLVLFVVTIVCLTKQLKTTKRKVHVQGNQLSQTRSDAMLENENYYYYIRDDEENYYAVPVYDFVPESPTINEYTEIE